MGIRKLFAESGPVVVTDPEDPLQHDEVLHPVLSPTGCNTDRPQDQLRRGRTALPDADVSTATDSHIPSNNARIAFSAFFSLLRGCA
jgi:hypothetical protein